MTSFISWIGVDSRGPASIYLASDSRISWRVGTVWDRGRKLFASRRYPEILGFVGDVLFASQILGQIIDLIDSDLLFVPDDTQEKKWGRISSVIKESFSHYPFEVGRLFTIVYATRRDSGMLTSFHVAELTWRPDADWNGRWVDLPDTSGPITSLGSGEKSIERWYSKWAKSNQGGTSRSVFSAFCDSLFSAEDPYTGGPPQLAGLYRIGSARSFGVIYRGRGYVLGVPAEHFAHRGAVEWRNSLFERCDPKTLERLSDAAHHVAPTGLGSEPGTEKKPP